jgi:hypothetical protein
MRLRRLHPVEGGSVTVVGAWPIAMTDTVSLAELVT